MATSTINNPLVQQGFALASGESKTIDTTKCIVAMSRGTTSSNSTVALKDQWGGVVYVSNYTYYKITASDSTSITVKNDANAYINCLVIPF